MEVQLLTPNYPTPILKTQKMGAKPHRDSEIQGGTNQASIRQAGDEVRWRHPCVEQHRFH
jgi:hypothetical protein